MPKRISRNQGRIELLACINYVYDLLNKGYDKRKIHKILNEEKKITMSYATLCYQLAKIERSKTLKNVDSNFDNIKYNKDNKFRNPKDIDSNTLF